MSNGKYDAGNPGDVKKAKRQRYLSEAKFDRGIEKICQDPDILNVLNHFFDVAGIFRDEPQIVTPDFVYEHGRNQGKKSAGLWWLSHLLLRDPNIVAKLEENKDLPNIVNSDDDDTMERD